ncbi:MAG: hypothetical protein ACYCY2_13465, partial [Acidithiobacillus ferriphilus]
VRAIISISPDFFWGLMESLLDDGYLPTENIIVIEDALGAKSVKEGNRRVASLKIILGLIDGNQFDLPQQIGDRINNLGEGWVRENSILPCTVYSEAEEAIVDKIVTRTHGKGSKAGRDTWEAVARARHNRDKNGASEITLDLLEKYLRHGTNFTPDQKARWAGRYNLSVLDEAIKRIATRFGVSSSAELSQKYPSIRLKKALDDIIHAIGLESLGFPAIRDSNDFALRFGVLPATPFPGRTETSGGGSAGNSGGSAGNPFSGGGTGGVQSGGAQGGFSSSTGGTTSNADSSTGGRSTAGNGSTGEKTQAAATTDERSVKRRLRALKIYGPNRAKLETLRKECLKLKLKDNPIAYCLLLRSMFEISSKKPTVKTMQANLAHQPLKRVTAMTAP